MRRIKKAGSAVCVAAALLLLPLSCLLQTAEGLRLRKTERRAAQREPGPRAYTGAQEGQIIFGEISEKVTDKSKKISNASADDEAAYQADFPGWSKVAVQDPASKDKWNQMATSLDCFGDHMKFRSLGPGASQFEVEQANKQSLPLAMVPQGCGYNMLGNSVSFVLIVPYSGCHMLHQGGGYKLPLRWKGHPLSLLCPKRAATFLSNLFHNWAHKHLWPRKHYWPHMHHLHFVPPVLPQPLDQVQSLPPVWPPNPQIQVLPPNVPQPQDFQVQSFPPVWPQNPQIPVLPPNVPQPQDHQVQRFPPVWPQNPQIQVLPPNVPQPQDHQVQRFPPVWPQNPQIQVLSPNFPQAQDPLVQVLPPNDPQSHSLPPVRPLTQDPQIQVLPPNLPQPQEPQVLPPAPDQNKIQFPSLFYDLPQVPVPPQNPQVNIPPPVHNLPQSNFFPYQYLPYFYGTAADPEKYPKYPPYPYVQFSFGQTPAAAPDTTEAPKVKPSQDTFFSHFPWSYGHHFSDLTQQAQYPEAKTTSPPTTTTQTPKNVPLQFYAPDNLPFFPFEHLPFSQMYPYFLG
ncbi:bromodomain-containing protein 4 [Oryzias melastigma]|uniref:bromodomain-containing protein 4 n=1 Tax=Oryzias melastigma TaxID=30732 RepID=UPI000CF82DF6|nr:bromodomain-containing protein 4 [Oryzias melastigma]